MLVDLYDCAIGSNESSAVNYDEQKQEKEKEKERIEQQPWRSFASGQRLIQTNIPRLSASQIRA